jgi:mannosyltransferase OCH1-like enzyme
MDIDAALVRPLERLLEGRSQMFVWDARHFSNFFLATVPRNPLYEKMLETIVHNIENYPKEGGPSVFYTTGPGAIQSLLVDAGVTFVPRQMACIQGVFTNERFQYMDRPRTKWKYKKTFIQE